MSQKSILPLLMKGSKTMQLWRPSFYCLELSARPEQFIAQRVFNLAWRFDFSAPGFAVLDLGPDVDSHTLRAWMLELKELLSAVSVGCGGRPFVYRSLGRFDQQETTKFHLDGAPEQALLLLGYEPSRVESRLFLADFIRAAFDLGLTPQQFLDDYNPMYRPGEEMLGGYTTEIPPPAVGHSRIVLINNSSLPFIDQRMNPLGVLHKAVIVTPVPNEQRVVNSMMLVTEGEEISVEKQQGFVTTDRISQKVY
jgi:hypothetical protein